MPGTTFRQIIYRITLLDGHVFGADGTDQAKNGMPIISPKILQGGTYWLKRAGWETFASWIYEDAKIKCFDLKVEQINEPPARLLLYKDIFQIVVRKNTNPHFPYAKRVGKKKKS